MSCRGWACGLLLAATVVGFSANKATAQFGTTYRATMAGICMGTPYTAAAWDEFGYPCFVGVQCGMAQLAANWHGSPVIGDIAGGLASPGVSVAPLPAAPIELYEDHTPAVHSARVEHWSRNQVAYAAQLAMSLAPHRVLDELLAQFDGIVAILNDGFDPNFVLGVPAREQQIDAVAALQPIAPVDAIGRRHTAAMAALTLTFHPFEATPVIAGDLAALADDWRHQVDHDTALMRARAEGLKWVQKPGIDDEATQTLRVRNYAATDAFQLDAQYYGVRQEQWSKAIPHAMVAANQALAAGALDMAKPAADTAWIRQDATARRGAWIWDAGSGKSLSEIEQKMQAQRLIDAAAVALEGFAQIVDEFAAELRTLDTADEFADETPKSWPAERGLNPAYDGPRAAVVGEAYLGL